MLVVRGTALVQEACDRHATAPTASAALGRALLGTLLMASFRGEGEKTQVGGGLRKRGGGVGVGRRGCVMGWGWEQMRAEQELRAAALWRAALPPAVQLPCPGQEAQARAGGAATGRCQRAAVSCRGAAQAPAFTLA